MRHNFQTAQWVPYPVAAVFAFFADPANLPLLMPAWQDARIDEANLVPPPPPLSANLQSGAVAGAGSRMNISFRPFPLSPIRMKWKAIISEFAWEDHFCDEQPQGPFAYWRHCHRVDIELCGGVEGTRVVDELVYELPFGWLSEPAHFLFVRRQIEGIFAYRQTTLLKLLETWQLPRTLSGKA